MKYMYQCLSVRTNMQIVISIVVLSCMCVLQSLSAAIDQKTRTAACAKVEQFRSAAVAMDKHAMLSLFDNPSSGQEWGDEIESYRDQLNPPEIEIVIDRVTESQGDIVVWTFVTSKQGERIEYRDHVWCFHLVENKGAMKIRHIEQVTIQQINNEFKQAQRLVEDVNRAVEAKSWAALCELLGHSCTGSIDECMEQLNKINMNWLVDVMQQNRQELRVKSMYRRGQHLIIVIEVVNEEERLITTKLCRLGSIQEGEVAVSILELDSSSEDSHAYVSNVSDVRTFWQAMSQSYSVAVCEPEVTLSSNQEFSASENMKLPAEVQKQMMVNPIAEVREIVVCSMLQGDNLLGHRIEVPVVFQYQFGKNGLFVVPLTQSNSIVGGHYRIPQVEDGDIELWKKMVSRWQSYQSAEKRIQYLANSVLTDHKLSKLHGDTICFMETHIGRLDELDVQLVNILQESLFSDVISKEGRIASLRALDKIGILDSLALLQKAIDDDVLHVAAAEIYYRRDPAGFRDLMMSWLADDSKKELAIRNVREFNLKRK